MDIPVITDINKASEYIAQGRVVAFPSGTSYGLAVDALQGHSLQRLRNLKKRPEEKTFTVFIDKTIRDRYIDCTKQEQLFLQQYDYTALTLLVKPKNPLMHLAQDGLVGLRVIDSPMMKELANIAGVPLTATSANVSGENACYDVECIKKSFPNQHGTTYDLSLACILDGGNLRTGLVSTIVKLEQDSGFQIIRKGSLLLRN